MAKRNIRFSGWDWSETETQLQKELLGQADKVNNAALSILAYAQKDFVNNLPAQEAEYMPFITGNLHDSIVCVLSAAGGRVVKVTFTEPAARMPSEDTGKMKFTPTAMGGGKKIFGHMEALRAAYKRSRYPSGIAATMMVAVPYAENPNEFSSRNRNGKHVGYLDVLASKYVKNIERAFKLYNYEDARDAEGRKMFVWKGGSLTWDTPILLR